MQVSATEADSDKKVAWSSTQPDEDTSVLSNDKEDAALSNLKGNADGRRAHFAKEENRKAVTIKPNHWFNMDFCNGRQFLYMLAIARWLISVLRVYGLQYAFTEAPGWSFVFPYALLGRPGEPVHLSTHLHTCSAPALTRFCSP